MRIVFIATDQSVAIKIPKSSTEREAVRRVTSLGLRTYLHCWRSLSQKVSQSVTNANMSDPGGAMLSVLGRYSDNSVRCWFDWILSRRWPQIWDRTERSKTYEEVVYDRHVWYFSQRHITGNDMMANSVDSAKHLNRSFPRTAWWLRRTFCVWFRAVPSAVWYRDQFVHVWNSAANCLWPQMYRLTAGTNWFRLERRWKVCALYKWRMKLQCMALVNQNQLRTKMWPMANWSSHYGSLSFFQLGSIKRYEIAYESVKSIQTRSKP